MASLVENGLFWMPSILLLPSAAAVIDGEANSCKPIPAAAAAPAIAVPARNLRRFRYRLFGVISEDGISGAFLISIKKSPAVLRDELLSWIRRFALPVSSIVCQIRRIWRWKVTFGR